MNNFIHSVSNASEQYARRYEQSCQQSTLPRLSPLLCESDEYRHSISWMGLEHSASGLFLFVCGIGFRYLFRNNIKYPKMVNIFIWIWIWIWLYLIFDTCEFSVVTKSIPAIERNYIEGMSLVCLWSKLIPAHGTQIETVNIQLKKTNETQQ